ncbi:unnamed protein product, partial [Staurois parvus]
PAVHPPVPPSSATHLCSEVLPTCAQLCHPPVPISATHLCPPVPPTSAHQCSPAVLPVSAQWLCQSSVPPISAAYPCHLISAAYRCCLSVPISAAYQCRLLVPISAASSTHISEGEKLPV